MKSMSLENFLKMLEEDNSSNVEEFLQKVLDKAEAAKEKEDAELKKLKQNLCETLAINLNNYQEIYDSKLYPLYSLW